MKKFLLILCSVFLHTGCTSKTPKTSVSESEIEATSDEKAEEGTELHKENNVPKITYINNRKDKYPKVKELNLKAHDQTDLMNSEKIIFPAENGEYYYIGDENNEYSMILGFDSGDGKPVPIKNGEECRWSFTDGDTVYGCHYVEDVMYVCKYESGSITSLVEIPIIYSFYFTSDYIYYIDWQEDCTEFYRTDYSGGNCELVASVEQRVQEFMVYDDCIYYQWFYEDSDGIPSQRYNVYNLESGEYIELADGGIDRVNGGYMYYVLAGELLRMNLEDYSIELVCEDVDYFEFCGDIIIASGWEYETDGTVFKIQNGKKQTIFDDREFLHIENKYEDEYDPFHITNIQYDNGRLFIEHSDFAGYYCTAEIDTDGNIIRILEKLDGLSILDKLNDIFNTTD